MRNACSLSVPLKVATRGSIIFHGRDRFACAPRTADDNARVYAGERVRK